MNEEEKDQAFETTINNFAATLPKPDITEEDKERIRKNREKSNSNLIPAKPGEVRNPAGRPKDVKYISEAIKERLQSDPELREMIVDTVIKEIKKGNMQALKEMLDRSEGKVADKLDLKGEILVTPDMRALAAREMIEIREEEAKLLNATIKEEDA